jgi:hypothetical protein
VLTAACGSKGPDRIDAVRAAANQDRAVSPVGQNLVDLLNHARTMSYHATYTVVTDDSQMNAGKFVVDIWRKPPMVREDTTNSLQGGTARSAEILQASGIRAHCEKQGNDPWVCTKVSSTVRDDFDNLVGDATAQLAGAIVTQTTEKTNGRTTQCFAIKPLGDTSTTACVTDDGIVTKIKAAGSSLEMTNLQLSATDKDFDPPAPVT